MAIVHDRHYGHMWCVVADGEFACQRCGAHTHAQEYTDPRCYSSYDLSGVEMRALERVRTYAEYQDRRGGE